MTTQTFVRRTRIDAPAEEVFRWHARPGALERLTPPWAGVQIVERSGGIHDGDRVVLRMSLGPTHVRWVAEHSGYVEGREFRDVQVQGPFARWEHTHRFEPDGPDACFLEDTIEYALPWAPVGSVLAGPLVRGMLERTFAYRHRTTRDDMATHRAYGGPPLHILLSGSTGLVGSALVPFLTTGGHRVTRLVRGAPRPDAAAVQWDPASGAIDTQGLEPVDAVIHLAGENIAGARWTPAVKRRIRASRTAATQALCASLARLEPRPKVLVSASAVGYYGDRGTETLTEDSAPGAGFLADVCRDWEAATEPAAHSGMRVVTLRIGVVLSAAGGALATMLRPFQVGLGGRFGSGTQYMSWITIDDLIAAILHVVRIETLAGPVNAVAPQPVTNAEFTRALGHVLRRPTIFTVPAAAARLAFGEMADEMLLAGARVQPRRLLESGYTFRDAELDRALRHTLGK